MNGRRQARYTQAPMAPQMPLMQTGMSQMQLNQGIGGKLTGAVKGAVKLGLGGVLGLGGDPAGQMANSGTAGTLTGMPAGGIMDTPEVPREMGGMENIMRSMGSSPMSNGFMGMLSDGIYGQQPTSQPSQMSPQYQQMYKKLSELMGGGR